MHLKSQTNLKDQIDEFKESTKPKMEVLNDFEIKIFPKEKQAQGKAYPLDLATENRT